MRVPTLSSNIAGRMRGVGLISVLREESKQVPWLCYGKRRKRVTEACAVLKAREEKGK